MTSDVPFETSVRKLEEILAHTEDFVMTDEQLLILLRDYAARKESITAEEEWARKELLKRMVNNGEKKLSYDGYYSMLMEEKLTAPFLERHYGFSKEETPGTLFTERVSKVLDEAKAESWLKEQGMTVDKVYSLRVGKEKVK